MKMIIFDFDGTLADSFEIVIDGVNNLALEKGYKKIKHDYVRNRNLRDILKLDFKLNPFQILNYSRILRNRLKRKLLRIKMFPGMKNVLIKVKEKYKLGIITSNSKNVVDRVLNNIKYDFIYFDIGLFGKDKIIRNVLSKYNVKDVIYVGDEVRDIEACKKIGVKVIAVSWGYNSRKFLEKNKPDFIVDDVKELEKILRV